MCVSFRPRFDQLRSHARRAQVSDSCYWIRPGGSPELIARRASHWRSIELGERRRAEQIHGPVEVGHPDEAQRKAISPKGPADGGGYEPFPIVPERRLRADTAGRFCHARRVEVDLLFDPFGARIDEVLAGATAAGEAGFGGVSLYDHLAGSVHGRDRVLECWTTLTASAATVPRIMVGPLVLNVANRSAGTLAAMAAPLQELSGGRLLLGIGAGGGVATPYAAEQEALGREVSGDARRRAEVADQIATLRSVWRGHTGCADGFLRPEPLPPIVVGGFGPKMAALAGAVGAPVTGARMSK